MTSNKKIKIGFFSLGCSKNLVDLQVMGAELHTSGYVVGVDPSEADVVIVNTCAFIEDARQEAIDTIETACQLKETSNCKSVIVTGCMAQRYRSKISAAFPEVDAIVGVDELDKLPKIVAESLLSHDKAICNIAKGLPTRLFVSRIPGFILTGGPFAYLKIGEGCKHACAFCAIPGIRGRLRSRTIPDILEEAKSIISQGIKEINIVAQDISCYGDDLKDGSSLAKLLLELDKIEGDFRMRLLYGHPSKITDELLEVIANSKHICHYLDIPIQHSNETVLRNMHRADTIKHVPTMAQRIRAAIPDVTLRTTCLVGFPGETEEQFNDLLSFIKKTKFDRMGAFSFSPEEGTPAFDMSEEPSYEVAEKRRKKLMKAQEQISKKLLEDQLGKTVRVLLEEHIVEEENDFWIGRTDGQAPDDIDGVTFVYCAKENHNVGDFAYCKIVDSQNHDFICEEIDD